MVHVVPRRHDTNIRPTPVQRVDSHEFDSRMHYTRAHTIARTRQHAQTGTTGTMANNDLAQLREDARAVSGVVVAQYRSGGVYDDFPQWLKHADVGLEQMFEWQDALSSDDFLTRALALAQEPTQAAFVELMDMMSCGDDFPIHPIFRSVLCAGKTMSVHATAGNENDSIDCLTLENAEVPSEPPATVHEVLACVLVLVRVARASGIDRAYEQVMIEAEQDEENRIEAEEDKEDDEERVDTRIEAEEDEEDEDEDTAMKQEIAELRAENITLRRRLDTPDVDNRPLKSPRSA